MWRIDGTQQLPQRGRRRQTPRLSLLLIAFVLVLYVIWFLGKYS